MLRGKNDCSLNDSSSDQPGQNGRKHAEQLNSHYVRFVLGRRSRQSKGHRVTHRFVVDSLGGTNSDDRLAVPTLGSSRFGAKSGVLITSISVFTAKGLF
jgi:hypothetical protein